MSIRVVFMGSPEFALPALGALVKNHTLIGVVTQPDRGSGRGRHMKSPPVKSKALEWGLPVIQPQRLKDADSMDQLKSWQPELIVVAAFGQILKPEVLNLPRFGCINIHASLLPRWRGAAPIHAAILAGDEQTGVTIMKMDTGLDTGPILSAKSTPIGPQDTAGSISETLSHLGADLLIETLPEYLSGKLKPQPQPLKGVTCAPMLKKEDGRLDFTRSARELERQVRALDPWPGAWFEWEGGLLKVTRASVRDEKDHPTGIRFKTGERPAVACDKGSLILEEVQPSGRRRMSGKSFLAGARDWVPN